MQRLLPPALLLPRPGSPLLSTGSGVGEGGGGCEQEHMGTTEDCLCEGVLKL